MSAPGAMRHPFSRSRITNGTDLLPGINARSAEARRYRDLVEGYLSELAPAAPTERQKALIRQAAAVTVQSETMQAAIIRGETVDIEQLTRLTNVLTRTLKELRIKTKKPADASSLADAVAAARLAREAGR